MRIVKVSLDDWYFKWFFMSRDFYWEWACLWWGLRSTISCWIAHLLYSPAIGFISPEILSGVWQSRSQHISRVQNGHFLSAKETKRMIIFSISSLVLAPVIHGILFLPRDPTRGGWTTTYATYSNCAFENWEGNIRVFREAFRNWIIITGLLRLFCCKMLFCVWALEFVFPLDSISLSFHGVLYADPTSFFKRTSLLWKFWELSL